MGGTKPRMRSKANNFIGGLHNSAAIAGVIVFALRLSCRDESLMHSCLVIMDGTSWRLPSSAAGAGRETNGGGGRARMYGLWTERVKDKVRDGQRERERWQSEGLYEVCAYLECHVLLQCFAVRVWAELSQVRVLSPLVSSEVPLGYGDDGTAPFPLQPTGPLCLLWSPGSPVPCLPALPSPGMKNCFL